MSIMESALEFHAPSKLLNCKSNFRLLIDCHSFPSYIRPRASLTSPEQSPQREGPTPTHGKSRSARCLQQEHFNLPSLLLTQTFVRLAPTLPSRRFSLNQLLLTFRFGGLYHNHFFSFQLVFVSFLCQFLPPLVALIYVFE